MTKSFHRTLTMAVVTALSAGRAAAVSYLVSVDTSSVSGSAGFLDFQFNPGNASSQPAMAALTGFTTLGGSLTGLPAVTGSVSGTLPGTVTFTNATALNEYFQGFSYGSKYSFVLSLSGPAISSPNHTANAGSTFCLGLYDAGQNPILTNDPSGCAGLVNINLDGTTSSTAFRTAAGGSSVVTFTPVVVTPPVISKTFGEVSIGNPSATSLTFTLRNPNTIVTLTGLAFTDVLPAGLVVANPNALTGACNGGTITAVANSNIISLGNPIGATLVPGASCTFTVNISGNGAALGQLTNTTSTVTSNESSPGDPVSAGIFVGNPFQISYAANLSAGDSVIDITNTGASGAALQSGTTAAITGAICANVYAFTPDEQMVACCSCPVTPNGLVSLSAKNDLAANTLTPAVPAALVVKVLATLPVAGACVNSAAAVTTATLANGIQSFGSTIHLTPAAGTYGVTERPFSGATLSAGELSRLGNLCNFIIANGSGFGICRSCSLGGLGADRQ